LPAKPLSYGLVTMSNFASTWGRLTTQKKAVLLGVTAATFAAFAVLINFASKPKMAFLYGGLDPAAAGEVLSALESMDVLADVRGEAIYVPAPKRDSVRMALARQGLPQQGQPGFELLDEMNGFATTAEMFDATYWRAKEGELARTIVSTPGVKAARVHLAAPKQSSFSRNNRAPTAAVTVSMSRGRLDLQQATAIRYLVGLAVPNLDPEQVAVIDSAYGVVLKPGADNPMIASEGGAADRERSLERSLTDLLEARVGAGNVRVSISLKIDREHETISERIIDPESRVVLNRETADIQQSDVGGTGAVTVASNLPDGEANGDKSPSSSQRSEANEITRFDVSEVQRKREKFPGAISRVHVAVLINDEIVIADDGTASINPRPAEELAAMKELVAASIGFDEARGDIVTVKSMAFHQTDPGEPDVQSLGVLGYVQENLISILQIVIPAIVVLALAFFVLRPILMQEAGAATAPMGIEMMQADFAPPLEGASPMDVAKSPVEELRDLSAANTEMTTTVLKSWLGEPEQAA